MMSKVSGSSTSQLSPNDADIRQHLEMLFAQLTEYEDGKIEIAYTAPCSPEVNSAQWFTLDKITEATDFAVTTNLEGSNIYVGPALRSPETAPFGRSNDGDYYASSYVWLDVDRDWVGVKDKIKTSGLAPVFGVLTGTVPEERRHLYFRLLEPCDNGVTIKVANKAMQDAFGTDGVSNPCRIMRLGGTVNYPHDDKLQRGYTSELTCLEQWNNGKAYDIDALSELSPQLKQKPTTAAAARPIINTLPDELNKLIKEGVPEGERSDQFMHAVGWLKSLGWQADVIEKRLRSHDDGIAAKYLTGNDRLRQQIDVCFDLATTTLSPAFTEDALASDFVARHSHDLRYVAAWNKWLEWTGQRWQVDDTLKSFDYARMVCRAAASQADKERVVSILSSAKTVAAVEKFAKTDRQIAATIDQWDTTEHYLNTPGGIVDLLSGKIRENQPTDYCTKITTIAPAPPGSRGDLWENFLHRVMGGDQELVAFLQRAAGYALTGLTVEHALFFLYGTGRNGKGVFLNTLTGILGDYASVAPMETFTASSMAQHPTDLAGLRGARLVTAQETEEGRQWAEAKIKTLTGGDPITARFMRQDFFTFTPQFKLFIAGNHKPGLRGVDEAMRARLNLVPFTVTIPREERDPHLADKLREEWPAILRWMIDGCLEWQERGLCVPDVVRLATDEYLDGEDALSLWLAECTHQSSYQSETVADLYKSWEDWAKQAGEHPGSRKQFSQNMQARGYSSTRKNKARTISGIELIRPNYTEDPRYGS
jgi:putative DNA primase/helicase